MTTYSLMSGAVAAAAIAVLSAGAASAEVYMKAAGAPGEATAKGYEQQITLAGASLNVSNMMVLGEDGETLQQQRYVGNVMITKSPDRASPKLALAAVDGANLGTVEITFTEPATRNRPERVKSRWILEGAEVRSFSVYPGAVATDPPAESVELSYRSMRYQVMTSSASGASTTEETQWTTPEDQLIGWDNGH
jgi:type VI secretion system Hcp family effector